MTVRLKDSLGTETGKVMKAHERNFHECIFE